jgi:hypothetical protein
MTTDWYDAFIIGEYHRTNKAGKKCSATSAVNLRILRDFGKHVDAMAPVQKYLFRRGVIRWDV